MALPARGLHGSGLREHLTEPTACLAIDPAFQA
jgi:hypothetical protein